MSDKSVEERVIRVFADFKKVPVEEITIDTTFEELGFDSLDGLNLVFELEEEFDLTIPDDRVSDMKGVRQAVEGIQALLEAKEQGIDVNAAAIDEFQKQREEVKTTKTADSGTSEETPAA
ncbi:MAG TPA: acyl carrier protein [Pyrinomonadaceae bacterium]|nr:acyl carrier protein [Pyrinomonadaceae bacterium]